MKKLSEELQIEESKIKEIIQKGNNLYNEFYNQNNYRKSSKLDKLNII